MYFFKHRNDSHRINSRDNASEQQAMQNSQRSIIINAWKVFGSINYKSSPAAMKISCASLKTLLQCKMPKTIPSAVTKSVESDAHCDIKQQIK